MIRNQVWFYLALLVPVAAACWFVGNSRAATETPAYKVVRADGAFELRDYPSLLVATTPMGEGGMNGGFGELFRFITGNNERAAKIAMTTPVLIDTGKEGRTMSFIMPRETAEQGVPKPSGDRVTLGKVEAAQFAVLRFGGGRTSENEAGAAARLKAWMDAQQIVARGEPRFAYYDPPWTPTALRRNEVLVRVLP